ncbi:MAG: serine hydrolase [Calditrichia bacterium]
MLEKYRSVSWKSRQSKLLVVFCCLFLVTFSCSEEEKPSLEFVLSERIRSFDGDVGIYVKHLKTGETVSINADSLFPTASMIKVPIMVALFQKMEQDSLKYGESLVWTKDVVNYPYGGGILDSFQDSMKISPAKLTWLMVSYSDNHASLWCQKLAGGGADINAVMQDYGLSSTRMNSRTAGREEDWKKYGWGQTTPREMAELVCLIRDGKAVSKAASEEMYRILCTSYWSDEAISQFPPTVQSATKQGAVNKSRSEVVLVNAPSGDYVFCVITNNQKDESWEYGNEGFTLIRDVSRIAWGYFEGETWSPSIGHRRYNQN